MRIWLLGCFVALLLIAQGNMTAQTGSAPAGNAEAGKAAQRLIVDIAERKGDVEIESRPLLAFPVQGVNGAAIWSGFGAERGKR